MIVKCEDAQLHSSDQIDQLSHDTLECASMDLHKSAFVRRSSASAVILAHMYLQLADLPLQKIVDLHSS
jgi:hypothetical protein